MAFYYKTLGFIKLH